MVSEQQADVAIKTLNRMIEAAENSNQAGEDAVVAAAAGLNSLAALREIETAGLRGYLTPELCGDIVAKAIAKAEGRP